MSRAVKVKAGSNSSTGRFEINACCSWEELKFQIRDLFDLEEDFTLKYIDDEDEVVTLGTQGELEEALKVTQKTGLLKLVVERSSDERTSTGIESFRDLLAESPKGTPVAPKRKFLVNSPVQSEESCAIKTAKMDNVGQETEVAAPIEHGASEVVANDVELPSKEDIVHEVDGNDVASEVTDGMDIRGQVLNTPSLETPFISREGSNTGSGEQYIPLVQLMVPPPTVPPPRPPPPSVQAPPPSVEPKKTPKGHKAKSCYQKLAESVAAELAATNDTLHKKLRRWKLQDKEQLSTDLQTLGDVEEDTYVFVNEENLPGSVSSGTEPPKVDHASVEETVHQVVQETLPKIVEQTLNCLKGLQIDDKSPRPSVEQIPGKPTSSRVVHKGIFCAECSQAVTGIRYKCCFCTDYDLCEDCEGKEGIHHPDHFFAKLRNHVPGIGRKNGEMIPVLKNFVYRAALKEKCRDAKNEEKKKETEERKGEKKKEKEERKEEKKKDKEKKWWEKGKVNEEKERKKDKKLVKAARQEEKDKRELKRRLRQIRHERDSATAMERLENCLNAEFIADASIPDGTILRAGQKFVKCWIVKNKGRRWNARTALRCVEGNIIVASGENVVDVPFLKPDEEGELTVPFVSPSAPGHYESKWQLCHHSIPFGPLFWCQILVEDGKMECELAVKEDLPEAARYPSHDDTSLLNSAFAEPDTTPVRKLVEQIVPPEVVTEEVDDASGSDAYLSSEETAEFEKIKMPLESVLVESQATQLAELEWDTTGCALDSESCGDVPEMEELVVCTNEDAMTDVESISSDVSCEFMVVPVPPCFDPEASLNADPTHVTVSVTEYKQMSESQRGGFSLDVSDRASIKATGNSGSFEAPFTEKRAVTCVGTMIKGRPDTTITSDGTSLEGDSNADQRDFMSAETTVEMTSATPTEQGNHVFDLENETVPLLPEPLIPEPGRDSPVAVESAPRGISSGVEEPQAVITHEPLAVPEPAAPDSGSVNDNGAYDDDDDDDDDDEEEAEEDEDEDEDEDDLPAQPGLISLPIAAQPVTGTYELPPVAIQPEPSVAVIATPTTVRPVVEDPRTPDGNGIDFPAHVVSDVLSTAFDAVASAGRAVITTVDNFFAGAPKPEAAATYNPEEGCEISVNTPAEIDSPSRASQNSINWTSRTVGGNTRVLELMENRDPPDVHPETWPPGRSPNTCLDCLMEMGFCDRKLNEQLLNKHNYNVALVVNELLSLTDNEWSSRRH